MYIMPQNKADNLKLSAKPFYNKLHTLIFNQASAFSASASTFAI